MDIPKCRSISSSRSKKGQPRRSARILPIVVVPTQLTPTRLTRNSDSSLPHQRSEGVRVRCRRYRGIGETADSEDSRGYEVPRSVGCGLIEAGMQVTGPHACSYPPAYLAA